MQFNLDLKNNSQLTNQALKVVFLYKYQANGN